MTTPTPADLTDAYNAFLNSFPDLFEAIGDIFADPDTYLAAEEIVYSIIEISTDGFGAGECIAALAGLP
jgi:hypothetical protein